MKYDFLLEYIIGNFEILEEKIMTKVLGIQIQADLFWGNQIDQMIKRASKTT